MSETTEKTTELPENADNGKYTQLKLTNNGKIQGFYGAHLGAQCSVGNEHLTGKVLVGAHSLPLREGVSTEQAHCPPKCSFLKSEQEKDQRTLFPKTHWQQEAEERFSKDKLARCYNCGRMLKAQCGIILHFAWGDRITCRRCNYG